MKRKYVVKLSSEERRQLEQMLSTGTEPARTLTRARILLKSDSSEDRIGWPYSRVSDAFNVSEVTIFQVLKAYSEQGIEAALRRKKANRVYEHKLNAEAEEQLAALVHSEPPNGQTRWTLRLLQKKAIELQLAESISHETVRKALKRSSDLPSGFKPVLHYLSADEVRLILEHCQLGTFSLYEQVVITVLLHTGIRAVELTALKVSDIVKIRGQWKLHISAIKGLQERVVPLTSECLVALQALQDVEYESTSKYLLRRYGEVGARHSSLDSWLREAGQKIGLRELTADRLRHTFVMSLLNYGIRESALQKLMGVSSDRKFKQFLAQATEQMQKGRSQNIPLFFKAEEYKLFADDKKVHWVELPYGRCRRHPNMPCENDVKCLLCDRYHADSSNLPRLQDMYERFVEQSMIMKAEVVADRIRQLQSSPCTGRN